MFSKLTTYIHSYVCNFWKLRRRLYLHGPQNFCHSSSLFSTCQVQLCVHYKSLLCSLVNLSQQSLSSLAIAILVAKKEERLRTHSISMQLRSRMGGWEKLTTRGVSRILRIRFGTRNFQPRRFTYICIWKDKFK